MIEFCLAIAAFVAAHVIPPSPGVRPRLVALLGRRAYLVGYSVLSLVLIVWLIDAARRAPYLPLWELQPWQAWVPAILMPLALWLTIAGLFEVNPLSVSLVAAPEGATPGPASAVTRHPVLWGFLIWSLAHLVPNGDVVGLVMFGGMAGLSVAGMLALDRRNRRRLGVVDWRNLADRTSLLPFVALATGRARVHTRLRDVGFMTLAIAVYVWFLIDGHVRLIGPDPLAWLSIGLS